jgi:hypothetical protein
MCKELWAICSPCVLFVYIQLTLGDCFFLKLESFDTLQLVRLESSYRDADNFAELHSICRIYNLSALVGVTQFSGEIHTVSFKFEKHIWTFKYLNYFLYDIFLSSRKGWCVSATRNIFSKWTCFRRWRNFRHRFIWVRFYRTSFHGVVRFKNWHRK